MGAGRHRRREMTYRIGQVVEVCSERSRGWTSGFGYGSKITLERLISPAEAYAGQWDAVTETGVRGIIAEKDFRPVAEGPVRTVTRQEIIPGTYDGVVVESAHVSKVFVRLANQDAGFTAYDLERAAAVLTALAGALRDDR